MGDFDFTEGPREEADDGMFRTDPGSRGDMTRHYQRQGFQRPYDRSPVNQPAGWFGGAAENTGGHMIVRSWDTVGEKGIGYVHQSRPGRRVEYQVSYGMDPWVTLEEYRWSEHADGTGSYDYAGQVEQLTADRNTDQDKAALALELMQRHSGKTR